MQNLTISQNGTIQEETKVVDIIPGDIITVITTKGTFKTKNIIMCPGPWANELFNKVGLNLPIKVSRSLLWYNKKHCVSSFL